MFHNFIWWHSRSKENPGRIGRLKNSQKQKLRPLKRLFDKNDRVLFFSSAVKFRFSPGDIHKTITKKHNMKYHKKSAISKQTEKQMVAKKTKCGLLLIFFFFLIDDSSWMTSYILRSLFPLKTITVAIIYVTSPHSNLSSKSLLKRNFKTGYSFRLQ